MLQVGIHYRNVGCLTRKYTLDASAGQAAPSDATDTANAPVRLPDPADLGPSAIGRVVIDENRLPFQLGQNLA